MFMLPKLNYNKKDLEPYLSEETITFHYEKHHQTYVDNLNILLNNKEYNFLKNKSLEDIILHDNIPANIFNNTAQIWHHNFYWKCLTPAIYSNISYDFEEIISTKYSNINIFKKEFNKIALSTFGSGWVMLIQNKKTKDLEIKSYQNANCPISQGDYPILTCDVWEHAYYIDYRNSRKNYLDNFWKIINWKYLYKRIKNVL